MPNTNARMLLIKHSDGKFPSSGRCCMSEILNEFPNVLTPIGVFIQHVRCYVIKDRFEKLGNFQSHYQLHNRFEAE